MSFYNKLCTLVGVSNFRRCCLYLVGRRVYILSADMFHLVDDDVCILSADMLANIVGRRVGILSVDKVCILSVDKVCILSGDEVFILSGDEVFILSGDEVFILSADEFRPDEDFSRPRSWLPHVDACLRRR